jgi:hypothetical protein
MRQRGGRRLSTSGWKPQGELAISRAEAKAAHDRAWVFGGAAANGRGPIVWRPERTINGRPCLMLKHALGLARDRESARDAAEQATEQARLEAEEKRQTLEQFRQARRKEARRTAGWRRGA